MLILCLNFTFTRPWNEMAREQKEAALNEILGTLGAEMDAIGQELETLK